ncbi:aldehyde dehydrogenase family protein [Kitasatospora sp. NPDC056181]|uniref:aldehyde dehydrogenase family protein n=1 Tax=Kitasatospora sp. NPDC056181 TaxID=3345737 RepID=UPI0035E35A0F
MEQGAGTAPAAPRAKRPSPPVERLRQLVGGRWRAGGGRELLSVNPARPKEVVATGRLAQARDLDDAVAAAREAFPGWAATPHHGRAGVLAHVAALLDRRAEWYGEELAREEGKTRAEGVGEVRRAAEVFRYCAGEASRPAGEVFASPRPGEQIQVLHRPVGVVAAVTPFNFPIAIPAWKIAPALGFGNTVVWKPSGLVPLLAQRLAETLVEAGLPRGVLGLLHGDGELGARLAGHPGVDAVTFTGSTAVGRALIASCGTLARPVQTELGGKNAAAVLADADLGLAAAEVVAGAFRSAGQKCTATSRLVVADAVADELIARVVDRAAALRVGDPLEPSTDMGPVVSLQARDELQHAVDAAAARPGAEVLTGGRPYGGPLASGAYLPPTVVELTGDEPLWHDDPLWREELFGPVLVVRRARDDREALRLVNDSAFGLAAAVFTNDLHNVAAAIDTLDVGVLHINSETAGADPHVPFGGAGRSGYGPREQGSAARQFFTTTRTVYVRASTGGAR